MIEQPLMIKCQYRANGIMCGSGMLHNSVTFEPLSVEGSVVNCPACEGKGMLLTPTGRELLKFLQTFPVNAE